MHKTVKISLNNRKIDFSLKNLKEILRIQVLRKIRTKIKPLNSNPTKIYQLLYANVRKKRHETRIALNLKFSSSVFQEPAAHKLSVSTSPFIRLHLTAMKTNSNTHTLRTQLYSCCFGCPSFRLASCRIK